MERALSRKIMGQQGKRDLQSFLRAHLPRLEQPASKATWLKKAGRIRRDCLKLLLRGHPPELLEEKPKIEWGETLETGEGYRIRKLRYEGYPGMWIPALLYEPMEMEGKVPAVLNPNGHHAGGKGMDYKQARCINLAKRGMLALNTEFIGMGELRADVEHNRIGHLDLCGVAGVGVFYLAMKRGLDVLLSQPHADPERVAMTGLSGGGWQTALLSALDERIRVVVPVAGHSPIWQRVGCVSDIGDLEQDPVDLCTVADYDALTGLFAPRPTLLIYNRNDDCCFQTRRTRKSVYAPVKPIFEMLGAADRLDFHDNVDPGTHNYEADNRSQLYKFLNLQFGLDTSEEDLPWEEEIFTEAELNVGLPADNATLLSLSQKELREIRREGRKRRGPAAARQRLKELTQMPVFAKVRGERKGGGQKRDGVEIRQWVLRLDDSWSLPVTEFVPKRASGVELIVGDGGRRNGAPLVRQSIATGRRVLAADLLGTGESPATWQCHMLLGAAGQRPLGILTGQLLSLLEWAGKGSRRTVHLQATGQVLPVVALLAAALEPGRVESLTTATLIDSLERLIDWPLSYSDVAPLFCFGLLREFDLPDLIDLSAPVALRDASRGPLRR
jgi:hypothetical protein